MTTPPTRWGRAALWALLGALCTAAAALGGVAGAAEGGDSGNGPKSNSNPAIAQTTGEAVDLIYLAAMRPIIIRLHISVDGKPTSEFRASIARRIFDTLDTDKNGLLQGKELDALPTPQMLAAAGRDPESAPAATAKAAGAPIVAVKGQVTPQEWSRSLFPAATSPLSRVSMAFVSLEMAASPDDMQMSAGGGGLTVLLSAIDANSDGRLSASELSRHDDLFRLLDLNDDEEISRSEFLAPIDPRWAVDRSDRGPVRPAVPFEQIPRTADKAALIRRLIQTFGRPVTDPKVVQHAGAPKRPGILLEIFAPADYAGRFDKNGDGLLDERELADWLSDPRPTCELAVEMAASSLQEPRVKVLRMLLSAGESGLSVETASSGALQVRTAAGLLELRAAEPIRRAAARTSRYRALFKRADQNNNNYLESSEIAAVGQGLGPVDFAAMDRDHNGMVFEDEWIAYLRLRDALGDGRLSLTISVESIDPLAQFDANHDGRLNRAELGRALAAIADWDRNHDGFVTLDEVPRTIVGTFHIGPMRTSPMRRSRYARMERPQPPIAGSGPLWFQKMDRNHDGEVTLREFLGPLSVFRRLDTNGDGRLDVREAESAQK